MKHEEITVVRIYLSEGEGQVNTLLKRLHDWEKVRGVTVFRGISGFGETGELHTGGLVDLSLNLPVVVEFFDTPDKIASIIEHFATVIKPGHMVWWKAQVNS
ncbi:MAG: hypothetical protein A2V90_09340 [Gammaproteobacteria bacterium RBG_16_57_12]|nr:MAG: hypothetical protein A2V90_09340 [Gammaproteobacteria bacterium RBG_16_57_12]